jgi:hypothetical protein
MGYFLAPPPGLEARVSASPKYKVLTDSFDWRALRRFQHFCVACPREPPVVVTAYRTSRIEKYWRPE